MNTACIIDVHCHLLQLEPVVVGFESKNYTVEEGQRYLVLPVVVQEGQLSEAVVLMAVTENKSATGIDLSLILTSKTPHTYNQQTNNYMTVVSI